jgi:hypothetical protein
MEDQNILSATQLNIVILNECRVSVQQKNRKKCYFVDLEKNSAVCPIYSVPRSQGCSGS